MNIDAFLVAYAAVLVGAALRYLIRGSKLDRWIHQWYGDAPWKGKKK